MKQILNGFDAKYFLDEAGKVFNSSTEKYIKPNKKFIYKLKLANGEYRNISTKELYRKVYNKNYCIDNVEDLEGEEWKFIEGTNQNYMCSSMGRIKSLQNYEAIILKPTLTKEGYYRIDICVEGQRKSKLVHRIIGTTFLMQPKDMFCQLHHKDFDSKNNCSNNLEWLSSKKHHEIHKKRREELKNAK